MLRQRINLDGTWDFVVDQDPKYHDTCSDPAYFLPDNNRRHWLKVSVPSVWQTYGARYELYEGVGWYAREFYISESCTFKQARLHFGAVNYACQIYLNGQFAGRHEGGYTPFALEVADYLKKGTNHIAVRVDNRSLNIKWPACLGYFNYAGMHRSVYLDLFDAPYLDEVYLKPSRDKDRWILNISGKIGLSYENLAVRVKFDRISDITISVDQKGHFDGKLIISDAQGWSPDNPKLYPVSVHLMDSAQNILDTFSTHYGLRTIYLKNRHIYLNDEPIYLKGICYVYDNPQTGLVMTDQQLRQDLTLIKQMGGNAVRCHYPMDDLFYTLCDQMGIMVWIEPPVYCYHPATEEKNTKFSDPEWVALARQMIDEMIRSAFNHPCVVIYGIGNECNTENPQAKPFFEQLASDIRRLDPTRLVSYAALYGTVGPIANLVDVLGVNSYWGWYDKIWGSKGLSPDFERPQQHSQTAIEPIDLTPMRKMLEKVLAAKTDLALLLTEFGADSVAGFYSKSRDLWSEDYHADLLTEILQLAKQYPAIVGTFPFVFSDYRDPSKVHNGYWNEWNLKGAVDYHRNKKKAFEALQRQYATNNKG